MNSKVPSSQMTNHRRITHLVVIPKLEVRKSQKAGFTSSCCSSSPQPHSSASQGLLSESEEKKGVQSKRNLHKTVRFQIDEQPEAPDSLSVLSSETLYRETAFIGEDEVATKEKMRDENSCKFCFVFQPPMPKGQGLNFFSCMICICFQANNYIVRLLGTLSYKHWVKIITLHCFILNYNYFC